MDLDTADKRLLGVSRRQFFRTATASGVALTLTRLALAEEPPFAARETLPGRQKWNPAATGVGRIDGVVKVTGAKLYASDFRAADYRAGRRRRRTPCWCGRRTRRMSMSASIFPCSPPH